MIDNAITKIAELVTEGLAPKIEKVGDYFFTLKDLTAVLPPAEPLAKPIAIHTLDGLVTYVKEKLAADRKHGGKDHGTLVHVAAHDQVHVYSDVQQDYFRRREGFVETRFESLIGQATPFKFGTFMLIEDFTIALQVLFVATEARDDLLRFLGNIRDQKVSQTEDDGVTQTVIGRVGIALNEAIAAPNPVTLAPWRTFREVTQPESVYVLRLKSGVTEGALPSCALFEADGGKWRLEAIESIAAYLSMRLPDGTTVIA